SSRVPLVPSPSRGGLGVQLGFQVACGLPAERSSLASEDAPCKGGWVSPANEELCHAGGKRQEAAPSSCFIKQSPPDRSPPMHTQADTYWKARQERYPAVPALTH